MINLCSYSLAMIYSVFTFKPEENKLKKYTPLNRSKWQATARVNPHETPISCVHHNLFFRWRIQGVYQYTLK